MTSQCPHPEKVKYRSERAARAGVKAMRGKRDGGEPLHAYRCGDHWHVGHDRHHRRITQPGRKFR